MAWVCANDVHATFTANHLAVFADPFNACADFHRSCSQNFGFIKARQYRNESHTPTRAIFIRNAFFRMERFDWSVGWLPPTNNWLGEKAPAPSLSPEPLVRAANPIHRLSVIFAFTSVLTLAHLRWICRCFAKSGGDSRSR